jgi:hypothetical protein
LSVNSWYKGNIHTHTNVAGGDASPEKVVRWYRRHGYDFLVLSDHNHRTILEYGPGKRRLKRPLMVPGEEVTVNIHNGQVPVHINAIGISRMVEPIDASEVVPTIQANVDAILQAGGIASINHPNFGWAFDHEQIKQVTGASLLEVFNGIRETNVYGAPGKLSNEQIWGAVLDAGRVIFGVATDDSHDYNDFAPEMSNPGRGWVMVRAPELTPDAIVEALASGDFYSSTGVTLASLDISQESLHLKIQQQGDPCAPGDRYLRDVIYSTTFIGRGGIELAEITGLEATYRLRGDEGYVRARVTGSNGVMAWTQPVFTGG